MTNSRTSAGQELAVGLLLLMAMGSSNWRAGKKSIQKSTSRQAPACVEGRNNSGFACCRAGLPGLHLHYRQV